MNKHHKKYDCEKDMGDSFLKNNQIYSDKLGMYYKKNF